LGCLACSWRLLPLLLLLLPLLLLLLPPLLLWRWKKKRWHCCMRDLEIAAAGKTA
jgi:hypothetical protein